MWLNSTDEILSKHKDFLAKLGWEFDLIPVECGAQLARLVGDERFQTIRDAHSGAFRGETSLQDLYACLETAQEAILFTSTQAEVSLAVGTQLFTRLRPLLVAGAHCCDLGCFLGSYAAWLAENYPNCEFVGFDCNPKAVRFADELCRATNLRFERWDYAGDDTPSGRFNVLYSIFGMEFDGELVRELPVSLDLGALRDCDAYRAYHRFAGPYFASWRRTAEEGASLLLVARITSFEQFLAVADAAYDAGWSVALDSSSLVVAGAEAFPLLAFKDVVTARADDALLRKWWGEQTEFPCPGNILVGLAAIDEYLTMPARCTIDQQDFEYPDGNILRVETGSCRRGGYLLHRSTNGLIGLEYSTVERVKSLPLASLDIGQLPVRLG
jgi:hypothetical protein